MKYGYLLILSAVATSCGLNDTMGRLDQGRIKADFLIEHLSDSTISESFEGSGYSSNAVKSFQTALTQNCDWEKKRGKFIDFYMDRDGNDRQASFIYEYFMDCDSLRIILTYDTASDSVFLISALIEPIEQPNPLLVDPMMSILKDADWEKKKH